MTLNKLLIMIGFVSLSLLSGILFLSFVNDDNLEMKNSNIESEVSINRIQVEGSDFGGANELAKTIIDKRFGGLDKHSVHRNEISECFQGSYTIAHERNAKNISMEELVKKTELSCLNELLMNLKFDEYLNLREDIVVQFDNNLVKEYQKYRYSIKFYEILIAESSIYAGESDFNSMLSIISTVKGVEIGLSEDVRLNLQYGQLSSKSINLAHSGSLFDIIEDIAKHFGLVARVERSRIVLDLPKQRDGK